MILAWPRCQCSTDFSRHRLIVGPVRRARGRDPVRWGELGQVEGMPGICRQLRKIEKIEIAGRYSFRGALHDKCSLDSFEAVGIHQTQLVFEYARAGIAVRVAAGHSAAKSSSFNFGS